MATHANRNMFCDKNKKSVLPPYYTFMVGFEIEAVKLWVHIGTTCIESHGVALESHLVIMWYFPLICNYVIYVDLVIMCEYVLIDDIVHICDNYVGFFWWIIRWALLYNWICEIDLRNAIYMIMQGVMNSYICMLYIAYYIIS